MLNYIKQLKFDKNGLIPAIAQDTKTKQVLMFAWMNKEALALSIDKKQAVYYSRSRQKLWHKGEESGYIQLIKSINTDCDGDVILLEVEQIGGISCHTGRTSCFFNQLDNNQQWQTTSSIIKDPNKIYK